jgi:hypothetical protein
MLTTHNHVNRLIASTSCRATWPGWVAVDKEWDNQTHTSAHAQKDGQCMSVHNTHKLVLGSIIGTMVTNAAAAAAVPAQLLAEQAGQAVTTTSTQTMAPEADSAAAAAAAAAASPAAVAVAAASPAAAAAAVQPLQ